MLLPWRVFARHAAAARSISIYESVTPSHIGRYEIQRRLGTGGMGALYLARDPALDRLVALKVVKEEFQEDSELRERFKREARSVARLNHRNIIVVYEIGEADGRPFIAMEYIAGETLNNVLRASPPLALVKRLSLAEELCDGLAHAHSAGIIHRDIKPANIMLDAKGVLKILDFGIARLGDSGITRDGMMMGTVNYMSPEQIVGRGVDYRTDIFAAGAVLYELITFEQAFPGRIDTGVLHRILNEGTETLGERHRGVDPELIRIVQHALQRDPADRYQDLIEMRRDVARVRERLVDAGRQTGAPISRDREGDDRPSDRKRVDSERLAGLRRQQVEEQLRFGEDAFARGDHDGAVQYAERALIVDPDNRAANDLIDRARFAIEAKALRKLLAEAERLLAAGHVDDAAALADEASVTLPDLRGAPDLHREIRDVADRIDAVRERERRINTSLDRARAALDRGDYDTALRSVYEVLSVDPDRREARDLEERAKSNLQAQREREAARQTAYDQLKQARALAADGKYDDAIDVINTVILPTQSVRIAAAEALAIVKKQQRQAAHNAVLSRARAAFEHSQFQEALRIIDEIPTDERSSDARSLRASAESALKAQRHLEQKRQALEAALLVVQTAMDKGDFAGGLERLDDAARIGLSDERIPTLRQRLTELEQAAREKKRQEARDRVAAKKVEAARQLLADGNGYAALALLDRDDSGHPQVQQALSEVRAAIAEQEERARQEAERRRQEEEAKRRAELEAARLEEERRKAEERRRRREEIQSILTGAEEALDAQRTDEAAQLLKRADGVGPVEDDTSLGRRVAAAKAEVDRRERARAAEARAREEERRRQQEEARQREEALTKVLQRVGRTSAHQDALDLLDEALTLAPGDARVQTLIRQRREALDRERDEERRRQRELEAARLREEQERAAEHARREQQRAAERARREQEQAAEKARREEEQRREQELTQILTRARDETEDDAALTLLNQAATLAPGDPRVRTLIAQRQEAQQRQQIDHEPAEAEPIPYEPTRLAREPKHDAPQPPQTPPVPVARPTPPMRVDRPSASVGQPPPRPTWIYVAAAAGLGVVLLIGVLVYRNSSSGPEVAETQNTQPPPAPTPVPTPTPAPTPPPPGPAGPTADQQAQNLVVKARALVASGQYQAALLEIQSALQLNANHAESLALRDQVVRDSATQLQRAKDAALAARADQSAARTYGQAVTQERAAQRERQAGRVEQALPLMWNARSLFVAATQEARAADQTRDQAARDQAVRDQAARDQAARDQAARDQATKDQAARDQAARDQAARDQAARDQAARDQAARDQAARDQATRDQARSSQLDETAVTRTLREYEAAYARRDIDAVARIRLLNAEQLLGLRKSFADARAYTLSVQVRETRFSADRRQAVVTANVSYTYVPRSGSPQTNSLPQTLALEKRGDAWLIVSIR